MLLHLISAKKRTVSTWMLWLVRLSHESPLRLGTDCCWWSHLCLIVYRQLVAKNRFEVPSKFSIDGDCKGSEPWLWAAGDAITCIDVEGLGYTYAEPIVLLVPSYGSFYDNGTLHKVVLRSSLLHPAKVPHSHPMRIAENQMRDSGRIQLKLESITLI